MVPAVREEFRAAGLTHLTAVSGDIAGQAVQDYHL
jgi:hypothetical protein